MNTPSFDVRHNTTQSRFETTVEGELARADYELQGTVMTMTHTVMPKSLEGRGIAGALVRAAIAHARSHGLTIRPQCSYVVRYFERHPDEVRDVVAR